MKSLIILFSLLGMGRRNMQKSPQSPGFAVSTTQYTGISKLYKRIAKSHEPIYATSDIPLHLYHVILDHSIFQMENKILYDSLQAFLMKLYKSQKNESNAKCIQTAQAAKRNMAFLSVPLTYLDRSFKPENALAKEVKQEISLIDGHSGIAISHVMGIKEDYTQYIPRGHYTKSERMKRYFKAMMYISRMGFYLRPGTDAKNIEIGRKLTEQALLLSESIYKDTSLVSLYKTIRKPIDFLLGKPDDLTPRDYHRLPIMGNFVVNQCMENTDKLDSLISFMLEEGKSPLILSTSASDTENFQKTRMGMKLLGQRFMLGSYIFQNLVYNKVGTQTNPRLMPKGLDVMAALGSGTAYHILISDYKQDKFKNYKKQMEYLKAEIQNWPSSYWLGSAFPSMLNAYRILITYDLSKASTIFLFNPALYRKKLLTTAMGSWAQMRHDFILYAKQSYTMRLTSAMPPHRNEFKPVVIVEPVPIFYQRMREILIKTDKLISEYGLDEVSKRLKSLDKLTLLLERASLSEEGGKLPSSKLMTQLFGMLNSLDDITNFGEQTGDIMPVIADVHTDPNTKQVLEVATGHPMLIEIEFKDASGETTIAKGGMFSYYEFKTEMSKRMTDEAWKEKLAHNPRLPSWEMELQSNKSSIK